MLITDHLYIRLIEPSDAKFIQNFEQKNKDQLYQWSVSALPLHNQKWLQRLITWQEEFEHNRAARFIFFARNNPEQMLGICNFTNILYGTLYSCYLGFTIDAECGNAIMLFEALQKTIEYVFQQKNLHRIMANYQPQNSATASLLKALGFQVEGYAYNYLLTDQGWQDYILTSLINKEWRTP